MTVNQITRRLHQKGVTIREPVVEKRLKFDLEEHVKQVHGRWAPRAEEVRSEENEAHTAIARSEAKAEGVGELPGPAPQQAEKKGSNSTHVLAGMQEMEDSPRGSLAHAIIRVLKKGDGALPTNVVVTRLSASGTGTTSPDVAAGLFDLKEEGHVQRDDQGRWHLADNRPALHRDATAESATATPSRGKPGEQPDKTPPAQANDVTQEETAQEETEPECVTDLEDEAAPQGSEMPSDGETPSDEEAKALVFRALASAPSALNSTEVAQRLEEAGAEVERETVVKHLYQLREEERVLVDRRFKWHAAQGERGAASSFLEHEEQPREGARQEEPEDPAPPFFGVRPRGYVAQAAADLERAKQLALVLELSPRPLEVSKLIRLFDAMGEAFAEEEAERLLAGPLCSYVQQTEDGWALRAPTEDDEARHVVSEESGERAGGRSVLAAQTRADGMEYQFASSDQDALAFFDAVREGAATTRIRLNTAHPAYSLLQAALSVGTTEAATPRRLLRRAQRALRLLLVGWARYEESLEGPLRQKAQKARIDWGRSVRRVVQRHEQQGLRG